MNTLFRLSAVAALLLTTFQMSGCVSSTLVDVWHAPVYQAPPLNKVLIVAVMKEAVPRRIWEDAFAQELASCGVAATPSYNLFPNAPPDTVQVVATVKEYGFDGILVTLRLPSEMNTQYIQGSVGAGLNEHYGSASPPRDPIYDPYYSLYWRRYQTYYTGSEYPTYTYTQTVDIRAIDVTTTGERGGLIWSATSRTPDPNTVSDAQRGIASLVVTQLAQRSMIPVKP